jgi:hypothetical protein
MIKVKEVLPGKNHHSNLEKGNCKDKDGNYDFVQKITVNFKPASIKIIKLQPQQPQNKISWVVLTNLKKKKQNSGKLLY